MNLLHDSRAARPPAQRAVSLILWATVLFILGPAADAASISAESRMCFGFTGSVDNPVLLCQPGGSGGGGAVVIGGSGVGSGINVPFQVISGTEFSASAAALQDYGIFRGYAHVHVKDQFPNVFGGVYAANAWGSFEDSWTILGGAGQGQLHLTFTLSGSATANMVVLGGNGSESFGASLQIAVRLNSGVAGVISPQTGGTYAVSPVAPGAMNFTFGVPFNFGVTHALTAGGGYNRLDPPDFYRLDANASFEHTAILTGIAVTDLFGNPIANFSLTAQSGTQYPLSASAVPLPAGLLLLASGVAALRVGRQRRC